MRSSTASLLAVAWLGAVAALPYATIDAGTINGGICDTNPSAAYFKSIPYAQPPVGELRFAAPRAPTSKFDGGTLNATSPAPACVQFVEQYPLPGKESEDCLYLDIWAPINATTASNLPVRVWIYGGANQGGYLSDPLYDGCSVPNTDAIMVSINYRVGALGFFALKEANLSGNQGIQDALLALQWVQDNIAAFGGDPKKVVLHGESAGALNTFLIASLPQAPELMSAAALQSGPSLNVILQDSAEAAATAFAQNLTCSTSNSSCLQDASIKQLKAAYQSVALPHPRKFPGLTSANVTTPGFNPSLDGKIIPAQPDRLALKVPSIVGTNSMEGTLFTFSIFQTGSSGPESITSENYDTYLEENFGDSASIVKQAYPLSAFNSTPYPAFEAMSEVFKDYEIFCPARRVLDATAATGVPVWTYLFSHQPKCAWFSGVSPKVFPLLGPTHTSEIPFVLGNTANLPQPNGTCEMSDDEKNISQFLCNAWTLMGKQQQPALDRSAWPAYNSTGAMGLNIVNSTLPGSINFTKCKLWDEVEAKTLSNGSSTGTGSGHGGNKAGNNSSASTPTGSAGSITAASSTGLWIAAAALVLGVLI